jgi:predicted DNA binding CopG/RHH family protein
VSKGCELEIAYEEPEFESDDEAAAWYMTHDTSKIPFERAELAPRRQLTTVAVRLPELDLDELKRRAGRLGIGYTTYIRMLVNRHLLSERPIGDSEEPPRTRLSEVRTGDRPRQKSTSLKPQGNKR